ncbi:MAG: HDOD domain-containing protein [Gemmatimonadota bacterium]
MSSSGSRSCRSLRLGRRRPSRGRWQDPASGPRLAAAGALPASLGGPRWDQPHSPGSHDLRIILAEHRPREGEAIAALLKRWKMDPVHVLSAADMWQALANGQPELLMVDWDFPGVQSLRLVTDLRRSDRFGHLPILVLAGKITKSDLIRASEAGVTGFVAAPIAPERLRAKLNEIRRDQARHSRADQAREIWEGRTTHIQSLTSPHVIFGEPVDSVEDLLAEDHRHSLRFLADAVEAIREANRRHVGLQAGYIIASDTSDLVAHLKRRTSRDAIRGICLSSRCRGNPTLIVRLFGINRGSQVPIVLLYDHKDEIPAEQRQGLKQLGVRMAGRDTMDGDAVRRLVETILGEKQPEPAEAQVAPEVVRRRVEADLDTMPSLPPLPQVYERISELARDPGSDLKSWAKVIKVDPMSSATVLRHANSLESAAGGEITQVERAVVMLGRNAVAGLVAGEAVRQVFHDVQDHGFALEEFWLHSVAAGFAAHILSLPTGETPAPGQGAGLAQMGLGPEELRQLQEIDLPARLGLDLRAANPMVGGMMHDLGKVAMVRCYPGLFPLLLAELEAGDWARPFLAVEQEVAGGLTHAAVGRHVAEKWKLGERLVRATGNHHAPPAGDAFSCLIAVADVVGQVACPFPRKSGRRLAAALDAGGLQEAGDFLPAGLIDGGLLSAAELTRLAAAAAPKVRYLTEKMRASFG